MKYFCKKSEHFWNEAQSRRHSFNSLYTDICMAHVLKCIQRHDNMPRNHKGNAGSSAGGAAFGGRGAWPPASQTGSPGRRPGLGGREASRRPPRGRPGGAGRPGRGGRPPPKPAAQVPGGAVGGGPSGQKRKRAALRAIFYVRGWSQGSGREKAQEARPAIKKNGPHGRRERSRRGSRARMGGGARRRGRKSRETR